MFKSIDIVKSLPNLSEVLSWLPVDLAGKAITEIVLSGNKAKSNSAVYHVVNPNTSGSWQNVIEGLRKGGKTFDVVERSQWLESLRSSDSDVEKNPTYKLLVSLDG